MVSVEAEMHELAIAEEAPEPRAGAEPPAIIRRRLLVMFVTVASPPATCHDHRRTQSTWAAVRTVIALAESPANLLGRSDAILYVKAGDPQGLGQSLGSQLVQIIARRGLAAAVAIGTPPDAVPQVSQCRVRGRGVEQPWGTGRGPCRVVRRC